MFDAARDLSASARARPATDAVTNGVGDRVDRPSVRALTSGRTAGRHLADVRQDADKQALLTLMASGAVDGQVARTLGVSVRTVRRRIAALLVELEADSRFQAGAEAARRGWI